jgi:ABC-2 type transport system permease protein
VRFREVLRFELVHQARRVSTWVCFAVLFGFGFLILRAGTPPGGAFLNAPSFVAFFTVLGGVIWLLLAASVAGEAAARDVETGMHPLTYSLPVRKADYLGGRFLAAFALNASMALAVQAGILLSLLLPGLGSELLGPFRPAGHLAAYGVLAVPTAFAATAIQFAVALRYGRATASYLASVLLLVASPLIATVVAELVQQRELARRIDLLGLVGFVREMNVSAVERNTRLMALEWPTLANRLLWIGIGACVLAVAYRGFRFEHRVAGRGWFRARARRGAQREGGGDPKRIAMPGVQPTFGLRTSVRQTLALAWAFFRAIASSRTGLTLVGALALGSAFVSNDWMLHLEEIPLLPRTEEVLAFYAPSLRTVETVWIVIPLLIVFYAGELVWRDRDAGMNEIVDAAPVSEWALFLGKLLGLGLVVVAWMALLSAAGVLVQVVLGHSALDLPAYLTALFGFQLADYVLFGLLVLVVHEVVGQRHLGYIAALGVYGLIVFAPGLGIEHKLLRYGSDLGWSYSPMSGFGPWVGPWLWFKLYWAGWALLLAVAARLLLMRGREAGLVVRLRMPRRRFTRATARVTAAAVMLMAGAGGFIFYNTNIRNQYHTAAERMDRRAEYERRYGQYRGISQPGLTAVDLRVEIHPERREVEIRGTYHLVNVGALAIDAIHLAPAPGVATGEASFDRPVARVAADDALGHRIYALEIPLKAGESAELRFDVRFEPRGFTNDGVSASVMANGTYFTNLSGLPAIGYQPDRELGDDAERRARGLAPRRAIPSLHDTEALRARVDRVVVDCIVGTDVDQIAVAPGALRRTWTETGRRYFHYVTDAPIGNEYAVFSASYAVHEEEWTGPGGPVTVQIFHHPSHTQNLDRIARSAQASLRYYTAQLGPYPFRHLRFVERPGRARGMHAEATTIDYREGFSLLDPRADRDVDLPFAVVAHEVAHQWWGTQLVPARVEGAGVLSESLATYSAMRLIEETLGPEHLRRYLRFLRLEHGVPRSRAMPPLLRATDSFLFYRKGPLALYALSEYIGKERVHGALRRLLEKHGGGMPPLPTGLDLHRELQTVTPEAFQPLLHDLFEANTFWDLETRGATAQQNGAGAWQVTLEVRGRKVVVDMAGVESDVPMDDWIEIGVFAEGDAPGRPSHAQKHRIRSGPQTITVTVPRTPIRAGIDPHHLLMDRKADDNTRTVTIES